MAAWHGAISPAPPRATTRRRWRQRRRRKATCWTKSASACLGGTTIWSLRPRTRHTPTCGESGTSGNLRCRAGGPASTRGAGVHRSPLRCIIVKLRCQSPDLNHKRPCHSGLQWHRGHRIGRSNPASSPVLQTVVVGVRRCRLSHVCEQQKVYSASSHRHSTSMRRLASRVEGEAPRSTCTSRRPRTTCLPHQPAPPCSTFCRHS